MILPVFLRSCPSPAFFKSKVRGMGRPAPKDLTQAAAAGRWPWAAGEALRLAGWTLAHSAILQVTRAVVDPRMPTTGGSLRHTYYQGMFVQVLIAPLMVLSYVMWRRRHPRGTLRRWLAEPMLDPCAWPSRLFFYNIMGHFVKDFATKMPALIAAHHVVCIATLSLQAFVILDGANSCLLGCAFFELGSAAYNLVRLYPGCERFAWVYLSVMTASNVAAIWTMYEWLSLPRRGPVLTAAVLAVTLGLAFMRQKVAIEDVIFQQNHANL